MFPSNSNPLPFSTWIPPIKTMDSTIRYYNLNPDPKLKISLKIQRDIDNLIKFIVNTVKPHDNERNREKWLNLMEHLQMLCKDEKSFLPDRFIKDINELYCYLYDNNLHYKLSNIINDLKRLSAWQNGFEC